MNPRTIFFLISFIVISTVLLIAQKWSSGYLLFLFVGPPVLIGLIDIFQTKKTIQRNFPVIGHFRYILESIRPEIMQYFIESDRDGRPFNRIQRSLVYQRAKLTTDTEPFGTQKDVYKVGYEWMDHSIYAKDAHNLNNKPRVLVGGPDCKQPYSASILNVSAMSFGSLSQNAIMALNKGAKIGEFAHNTGEGSISPYHQKYGGDLVWQIGTGYFGCRDSEGNFDPEKFKANASQEQVKMIEIKVSQGAKPGHGGILPARKNTPEIAKIRGIEPFTDVHSPPYHSAFTNPMELTDFIAKLRELSGGKPIGFKICIGRKQEFIDLCLAFHRTGIKPDFIVIDGGEGGTGAAPIEFSNYLGMPMRDALAFAYDMLTGFDMKKDIKLISSGRIVSGFHLAKALSIGADMVNSARAMMMSIGCIQALRCNHNNCPAGVATQDPALWTGLDVDDKAQRCSNYHSRTLRSMIELVSAAGLSSHEELVRYHVNRRVSQHKIMHYGDIYPYMEEGIILDKDRRPEYWNQFFND